MWNGSLYSLMVIVGPLLLFGAIVWAYISNRRVSARNDRKTEEATRRLYDEVRDRARPTEDLKTRLARRREGTEKKLVRAEAQRTLRGLARVSAYLCQASKEVAYAAAPSLSAPPRLCANKIPSPRFCASA